MRREWMLAGLGAALTVAGCGGGSHGSAGGARPAAAVAHVRPGVAAVSPGAAGGVDDVEADEASPLPKGFHPTRKAARPGSVAVKKTGISGAGGGGISPGAPSDDEIAAELKEMDAVNARARKAARNARPTGPLALTHKGNAETPDNAPEAVAAIIAGANEIARFPYVYGGGHGSFVDSAYDCSGSVSYALATAGLLNAPLTSGQLAKWGAPGPGRWVTIYANAGHTFMFVAGTRYDTSGRAGVHGSRWQPGTRNVAGFKVRHPPGL